MCTQLAMDHKVVTRAEPFESTFRELLGICMPVALEDIRLKADPLIFLGALELRGNFW